MDEIEIDYEGRAFHDPSVDLKVHGLDRYSAVAQVTLCAYRINGGPLEQWDINEGRPFPADLAEGLADPRVRKWAFNAQFERVITNTALGIMTPHRNWRCTMVLAFMQSFVGGLADVGNQMGLPDDFKKMESEGKAMIKLFCMPHKVTAKNPHLWRTADTDPDKWEIFRQYNRRDVIAEAAIRKPLLRFPVTQFEWDLYELDQIINDRGLPVSRRFVDHAIEMANRRTRQLVEQMKEITGLANPNSRDQLLPWIMARGYGFNDLGKDTVVKSLREDLLSDECRQVLKLRQWAARMSVKKYVQLQNALGDDGNMRFLYQFAGAQRTNRWSGRRVQTQNLPRTPKVIEDELMLEFATDLIERDDYETLTEVFKEPMEIIVGTVRSAFSTLDGEHGDTEYVVCDLSSIETVVIAWLAGCKLIMRWLKEGKDPYKGFGSIWLRKPYEDITKQERNWSKPAMLGGGYRLSGGEIETEGNNAGKKTGLWGYAENMQIFMDREQAHDTVKVFREEVAPEVVAMWKAYEAAAEYVLRSGKPRKVGPITFEYLKPYLMIRLPSGRRMFYYKPRLDKITIRPKKGDPYTRLTLTYMGMSQGASRVWKRIPTHGGKLTENCLSADSLILTPSGPKRIVEVTSDDQVWDGDAWVVHHGLVAQGVRETIDFGGLRITPDHLIEVDGEWTHAGKTSADAAASSFERYHRDPFRPADSGGVCRLERPEILVAHTMRLREGGRDASGRVHQGTPEVMRVCAKPIDQSGQNDAWHDEPSGFLRLAFDAGQVQSPNPSGISELRSPRHSSVPSLECVVSEFLVGHGTDLPTGFHDRTRGQHEGIQQGELPLGHVQGSGSEQTHECHYRHTGWQNDGWRSSGAFGDRRDNAAVPPIGGLACGTDVRSARRHEQVFDLLNCGPNHRFTVVLPDGRLILVHNCVQALARDILAVGIVRAHKAGFNIRGHVHDEIKTLRRKGDTRYGVPQLAKCMTDPIPWAPGLPLKAAGWAGEFYKKD